MPSGTTLENSAKPDHGHVETDLHNAESSTEPPQNHSSNSTLSSGRRSEYRDVPPELRERYQDIRFLGEGGMGTVFRAHDPRLGRTVALKLLKHADPNQWDRFLQEARAQARIEHENVCRVYDTGEASGEPYIAMQFIAGESLGRAKNTMSLEQKIMVMRQVCLAVHQAHRQGLIHRDIKPGNILIERQEDGSFRPYVMDFGLAREVHDQGQTATGAILGTPAYMSPEQAQGEVRSLDRRSDVYSLGATLYELLAGRPPFVAENSWKLLLAVAYEDVPALSKFEKNVPAELEIMTMKCLEREPVRRYDSARALAEDLQRFLDGEPILAKRSGPIYFIWKKARKNKLTTLFITAALVLLVVVIGVWRKGKKDIVEQARLAQELGKDVTEMELFMRSAYTIPLHDVERERNLVRKRLEAIEKRMAIAGDVGKAPADYAIGRGYLALDEPEKAHEHLERARVGGYASPELDYALGRALGELYRKALDEVKRIQDKKEQAAKIAQIEKQYRDPALLHLRAALPAQVEVPAYAEGLIAFYDGKYEDALVKAKEAFEQAPWFYEAKKLEGDALFMLGSRYRHDAAFDWDKMMAQFHPAAEAYRNAAEIARSAPDVHRAECELWFQVMNAVAHKRESPTSAFEKANHACARAIEASSAEKKGLMMQALVHSSFALQVVSGGIVGNEDPRPMIDQAVLRAREAIRLNAEDPMAHYILARLTYARMKYGIGVGLQPGEIVDQTVSAYEDALRLDPRFLWAVNELAQLYVRKTTLDSWRGVDVTSSAQNAIEIADKAIALDPTSPIGTYTKARAYLARAEQALEKGQLAREDLELATQSLEASQALAPKSPLQVHRLFDVYKIQANYEIQSGADPHDSMEKAKAQVDRAAALAPDASETHELIAAQSVLQALYALRENHDPSEALDKARPGLDRAIEKDPRDIVNRISRARIEIIAIQWALKQKKAHDELFDAARKPLEPLLSEERDDPSLYETLAEIHAYRAEWLLDTGKNPSDDIKKGLAMATKALGKNALMAKALLVKGRLHLLEARATKEALARADAARSAKEAFDAAFEGNPLLKRGHEDDLRAVGAMP